MAASIDFYTYDGSDFNINLNASGIGFYGATFGRSVRVGYYQDSTYVTDSNGVAHGAAMNNVKYVHPSSGYRGAANYNLLNIPNYLSTLNARFTYDTAVQVQNTELRIYDRSSINNDPSGVTCQVAELRHPSTSDAVVGSGSHQWTYAHGSTSLVCSNSPGMSGLYVGSGSNSLRADTRHDYYFALSASPDSVGQKTAFSLFFSCEYL